MKVFKILLCMVFVLLLSSCHGKKESVYDYPDDEPITNKGEVGDPCNKKSDCKDGLLCIDKVCSEPTADEDSTDNDDSDDKDDNDTEDDSDTDTKDDTDSGNDDSDTQPQDDTDTGINDEDEPEDSDTMPDGDTEPYVPGCGNGIKDPGEDCDNGLDNSDEPGILGITCRTNCTLAVCGDNILDNGELCDDGNRASGDYCRADCQAITGYCGDGIEQTNEECDKRNNPYCAEDCQTKLGECGDGIKQDFEKCDKASSDVGEGQGIGSYCSDDCQKIEHRCGDGSTQPDMEECDDGAENGKYNKCAANCKDYAPYCGDGILHRENCAGYKNCVVFAGANEVCDDGNNEDGDYCSADCQTSFGSCGDGTVQEGLEVCDKAPSGVGEGQGIGVYCSDNCQENLGRCGDEIIQEGIETCDYGDGKNGIMECPYNTFAQCEVCDLYCQKKIGKLVYCGDGVKQDNEECDKATTGAGIGPYYCSSDCKKIIGYCGDGVKQDNEECDPNKADDPNSPYCSADCKLNGRCGDGTINGKEGHEECDNGETGTNPNGNTKCPYGETSCEVCTTNCKKAAGTEISYCGNGGTDESNGEKCDDSTNNGKYSPYATTVSTAYCNSDCKGRGEGGFCGDGSIQRANCGGFDNCTITEGANEACDNGDNNGEENCAYGETSCKVCTKSCVEQDGITSYCGDGITNGNEACDDGNNENGDYCSSDCMTVTGSCGDGTKQDNEACDKAEPNVGNHQGIGSYCSSDCNTKLGECGDGTTQEGLETCDDGRDNNGHYQHDAPGHCNSDCNGHGEGGYCGDSVKQDEEECEHYGNIQIYCTYGETECQVCTSSCTYENGQTAFCNDGILQRADCTGYEDKGCVVTAGANEVCDEGETNNGKYGGFCNATCTGFTPYCNDGILQRTDCTGYEDKNCVEFEGANEVCDEGIDNNGHYKHDAPGHCNHQCNGYGEGGFCGDGNKDDGEECDNNASFNGSYGFCNKDCDGDAPKCGDGIIHREDCTGYENCVELEGVNEECDDGNDNGNYGKCNRTCTAKFICNDGKVQKATLEACNAWVDEDPGNRSLCDENTTANCCEVVPGANEICDDGDENGGYEKCNATCSGYNEGGYCGDGKVQRADCAGYTPCDENTTENCCVVTAGANEMCDGGENNGKYSAEAPGYCNSNCDGFGGGGTCNDGKVQKATDEACNAWVAEDSGNRSLCDESTTENCCEVAEGANENCDEGVDNGLYNHCNLTCSAVNSCGDNIKQEEELCDQGIYNGTYGNRCNETCDGYTGYCNDGKIQKATDEACNAWVAEDPGNRSLCNESTTENCCEVVPGGSEECDDTIFYNGEYGHCNKTCTGIRPERCGDGKIQKATDEACNAWVEEDPGNRSRCDVNITENCCEVVPGADENCDEGDGVNGDFGHCDKTCHVVINYRCGDGKRQTANLAECGLNICSEYVTEDCCEVVEFAPGDSSEYCDAGSNNGKNGYCNLTCTGMTPYCGDNIIQREDCQGYSRCQVMEGMNEECDQGGENGSYGHCNDTCTGMVTAQCGDGIIQREYCEGFNNCEVVPGAYENCDEQDINGLYYNHCDSLCLDTNWNGYCGDGKIQKASEDECEAWVAEDSSNRNLCDENTTENCCEVVNFKPGDPSEDCDEGPNNGYHGHCNETCNGISSCGDGVIGKDEICEPGLMEEPIPCETFYQFQEWIEGENNYLISECDNECMPLLTNCAYKPSYQIRFFDTKQTQCYDNSAALLEFPDESSNFYGQSPQFSYLTQTYTVEDDTITETVSGLTWQKTTPASYNGCAADSSCTLDEAIEYCENLDLEDKEWRLPSILELPTITDFSTSNHIYSGFTNTNGSYWTSEGAVFSTSNGTLSFGYSGTAQVKCVTSDYYPEPETLLEYGHILLTGNDIDKETTIITLWYFEDLENGVDWEHALLACKTADFNNMNKMRLPTVNEILYLFDTENGGSLISGFIGTVWTSTTLNNDASSAYVVNFNTASLTTDTKSSSHIVICVE
jgi:Cobalamin biosynthesis protein CobT (nicotinate-mononucleotide:5, 6-dimethylbenzimidazole phosphoribosyltransferase)